MYIFLNELTQMLNRFYLLPLLRKILAVWFSVRFKENEKGKDRIGIPKVIDPISTNSKFLFDLFDK